VSPILSEHSEIDMSLCGNHPRHALFNVGIEAVGNSPEEFAATVNSEMAKWGKVIKDAGIRAD
jgi:tripartite-type tricarboxylate transporter receptor subunit TctC